MGLLDGRSVRRLAASIHTYSWSRPHDLLPRATVMLYSPLYLRGLMLCSAKRSGLSPLYIFAVTEIHEAHHQPLGSRVSHLLNRHHFHLKKVCMIQVDYPRSQGSLWDKTKALESSVQSLQDACFPSAVFSDISTTPPATDITDGAVAYTRRRSAGKQVALLDCSSALTSEVCMRMMTNGDHVVLLPNSSTSLPKHLPSMKMDTADLRCSPTWPRARVSLATSLMTP